MTSLICQAIAQCSLLEFEYRGMRRVVAPYCHGVTSNGVEMLRAIQIRGESASKGFGFGKLWNVSELRDVRLLEELFAPDDPNYNPNDSAFQHVHCAVRVALGGRS